MSTNKFLVNTKQQTEASKALLWVTEQLPTLFLQHVYCTLGVFIFLGIGGKIVQVIWKRDERNECLQRVKNKNIFLIQEGYWDYTHQSGACGTEPRAQWPAGADVWKKPFPQLDSAAETKTTFTFSLYRCCSLVPDLLLDITWDVAKQHVRYIKILSFKGV